MLLWGESMSGVIVKDCYGHSRVVGLPATRSGDEILERVKERVDELARELERKSECEENALASRALYFERAYGMRTALTLIVEAEKAARAAAEGNDE
jgi:hypothetical protein